VFARLCQLGVMFAYCAALPPAIENFIAEVYAECSKIARQERNVVLITVAGKHLGVRQVIAFRGWYGCRCLFHIRSSFGDLRMVFTRNSQALFPLAFLSNRLYTGIEYELCRQRQSDGVVELHRQIRQLE